MNPFGPKEAKVFTQEEVDENAREARYWDAIRRHSPLQPCPGCGHVPGEHPNEFELEHEFVYPETRDRSVYGAHCTAAGIGCGWKVIGESIEDVVERWNKRWRKVYATRRQIGERQNE